MAFINLFILFSFFKKVLIKNIILFNIPWIKKALKLLPSS